MGTLKGFPNPPTVVRRRQSRRAPHAKIDGTRSHPTLSRECRPEGRRGPLPQTLPSPAQGELRYHRSRRPDCARGPSIPFHFDLRILAGLGLNPVVIGRARSTRAMRIGSRSESWNGCWKMRCRPEPLAQGPIFLPPSASPCAKPYSKTPSPLCRWTRPRNSTSKTASVCCTAWPLAWKPASGVSVHQLRPGARRARPPFRWSTCPTTTND